MSASQAQHWVMLHGWGTHGAVWDRLIHASAEQRMATGRAAFHCIAPDWVQALDPLSDPQTMLSQLADQIAAQAPAHCAVIGWSLGGQLALRWAARHPQQVQRLILVATTPCFAHGQGWTYGLPCDWVDQFIADFQADPLATLRRFYVLQTRGEAQARQALRQLLAALATRKLATEAQSLALLYCLATSDLRADLPSITQPTMIVQGLEDVLTIPAAADYLASHIPTAQLQAWPSVGHLPLFSQVHSLAQLMSDFCDV